MWCGVEMVVGGWVMIVYTTPWAEGMQALWTTVNLATHPLRHHQRRAAPMAAYGRMGVGRPV
jgi:hypothetical protein